MMYQTNDQKIIKQYTRCITTIARVDFPENWPTLVADIMQALNSQNEKGTLTGLLALLGLVKKYEFEMDKDREPLFAIWGEVMGLLGNLVNQVIGSLTDENALAILHLIGKVFYASN